MSADPENFWSVLQSDDLLERLASAEHERWSHWQAYLHAQCVQGKDGALIIPADLVSRWSAQMNTSYEDLPESERQSDRDQVRRYLPIILEVLRNQE